MKRDMDLCRRLLLALEEADDETNVPEFDNVAVEVVHYHLTLLCDADLIEAHLEAEIQNGIPTVWPQRITWAGHEFLAAARSETAWQRVKDKTASVGGVPTFTVLLQLLKLYMQQEFDLGRDD